MRSAPARPQPPSFSAPFPSCSARERALIVAGLALGALALGGCSGCGDKSAPVDKNPVGTMEALRDALQSDDPDAWKKPVGTRPPCADAEPVALAPGQTSARDTGCFAAIATTLGSKRGFSSSPPDQASATTVAIVLLRDGRGDWVSNADAWLGSMKGGKGPGPDALRLAVAARMVAGANAVGARIDDDAAAIAALRAVAGALPGACPTYHLVGAGRDTSKLPAELSPDHAACVQHDLARREGPGARYGFGVFRALEGALALWRESERALRMGLTVSSPETRAALEKRLAIIEPATQKIATRKLAGTTSAAVTETLGDIHADAGYVLWQDAGADGGAADAAAASPGTGTHPAPK